MMSVSYNKLWKLLVDKNMNKTELKKRTGIGSTTLSKLSKNQVVSMEVIIKICDTLQCDVGDIMNISKTRGGESRDFDRRFI
jgi:DNA-binding Xre family transcriptional regulator